MLMACHIALDILCLIALQVLPLQVSGNSNCPTCQNGGSCVAPPEGANYGYRCLCAPGFTGSWCGHRVELDCGSGEECQCGQNYQIASSCIDNSRANNFLFCSLREILSGKNVPECGTSADHCPFPGYIYSKETGRCYALNRNKLSWDDAQEACTRSGQGAMLIQLTSKEANDFIQYFYNNFKPVYSEDTWIGLTDSIVEGNFTWTWVFSKFAWKSWAGGSPTSNSGDKNCVYFQPVNGGLSWNPAVCSEAKVSLCETAPLCKYTKCRVESVCEPILGFYGFTYYLCCQYQPADICYDRNQCDSNPCKGDKPVCVDAVNSYYCKAGPQTTPREFCNPNPCNNEGSCVNMPTTFNCLCKDGFTGNACESRINYCKINPCKNGGICESISTSFTCTCRDGFQGNTCETSINYCETNPCKNGGACDNMATTFKCTCRGGFQGDTCETIVEEPLCSSPCKNGGTCSVDRDMVWGCVCAAGFNGQDCGFDVNECESRPCTKEEICTDKVNGYECRSTILASGDSGATNLQPIAGITPLMSLWAILLMY